MSNNFHESHWGQCLELLSHLCQYGDEILLVTGPAGIGKTTMRRELMQVESANFVFCDVVATTDLTPEELIERIEDLSDPQQQDVLLLIDDAQYLSFEVITILLQLKQRTNVPLHIVLFASAELAQKISRSVLKEDFFEQVHTIEIEPLTVMELEAFLMHQWRNTHNNNDLELHKSKYKKIHALSQGIPGKALQVAKDILAGKSTSENNSQRLSPVAVGVTVSFGILFCVLAVLWPAADETMITASSALPEAAAIVAAAEPADTAVEAPQTMPEQLPEPAPMPEPVPTEPNVVPQPVPEPDVAPHPELVLKLSDDEKIARLEKKLQVLQEQLHNEQNARKSSELKLQQINKKALAKPTANKSKTLSFSKHESQILAQPSQNFTLQLLGSNSEKKVQTFIRNNNLSGKAFYYKGLHKGKAWYVVVSGNYATKFEAQQALAKLPYAIRKLHPWPRQYSKIHDSIKARNANG